MCSHQEEHRKQQPDVLQLEPHGRHPHDDDLRELDEAHQIRAVVAVGQVAGGGREEEEGQDGDPGRDVHHDAGVEPGAVGQAEGDQHRQGALEEVVVEGPQELRQEKGQKTARVQERELVLSGRGHDASLPAAGPQGPKNFSERVQLL